MIKNTRAAAGHYQRGHFNQECKKKFYFILFSRPPVLEF